MHKKLLFITSILLLLIIVAWDKFLYKRFLTLNSNFSYVAEIVSLDNFYDSEARSYQGEQNFVAKFSYQVMEDKKKSLVILNSFDVKTVYGDTIVNIDRLYGINKINQKHDLTAGDQEREGYLFAPKNLVKGETFKYWHINYDAPATMSFVKEENINGLDVYIYESKYNGVIVDQTNDLTYLPGVPEERGVVLSPHLTIWIEPTSGWLVKYTDQTDANYYDIKTNKIIEPWNSFRNYYTASSIDQHVTIAKSLRYQSLLVHYGVMVFIFVLWILTLIVFTFSKRFNSSLLIKGVIFGLLFFLIITATIGAWWHTRLQSEELYSLSLESAKQNVQETIIERMNVYSNALNGINGFLYASDQVSRKEWKTYVDSISIQSKYPGLQGFGYATMIEKNEIDSLEKQVRSEGFPDFIFYPRSERELYSSIIYIEPFDDRNQRAFGFDMFSESTRNRALKLADETQNPTLSGKVILVQEFDSGVQPGLLMYLPYYEEGNLEGYVYSIFRMYDLVENTFSLDSLSNLGFRIYDASETDIITENTLLFDSEISKGKSGDTESIPLGQYSMYLYNSKWIIEYFALSDSLLYAADHQTSNVILLFGVTISIILLIFFVILLVNQYRRRISVEDITKQLDQEKNLIQNRNESLDSQINKFNMAQKISQIGYFEYDFIAEQTYWTEEQFHIHNIDQKNEPINYNNYIDIVTSEYKKRFEKNLNKLMDSKQVFSFTYPIIDKSKKSKWIKISGLPIYKENKVIKVIGTMQDVTAEKLVERSHQKLIDYIIKQLQTPLESKKGLLKTLFNSGVSNLNSNQLKLIKNVELIIDSMLGKTKLLSNIINLERGLHNFSMKLFHPQDLLKLVVDQLSQEIKIKKLKLIVEIDDNITPLVSDVELVRDVLSIVLSNAIVYSSHLSELKINVIQDLNDIVFSVVDRGYGIPEADKEKIFLRYYRGSNVTKYNRMGTGLSLSYAKKVLTLLGGSIKINSKQDQGTTVIIKVPKKLT